MKVLVLLGGNSDEREVSLRSGRAVIEALRIAGHETLEYDPAEGLAGLDEFTGKVDCVFPIMHGAGGEDGSIQAELEKQGLKYLGADAASSVLCFQKNKLKELLNKSSILTPKWEIVDKENIDKCGLVKKPFVLKPIDGGSSIDTFIIRSLGNDDYDPSVFDRHKRMLIEELIEGNELTVPVLGNSALPVIEIIPPKGLEFDYENKYNGATQEICPPKNISQDNQAKAQKIAEKIHGLAGVRHLSRTDFILSESEDLFALEINTIPGMTSQSLYPKSAAEAGISMPELMNRFVEMVMDDSNL